MKKLSLKKLDLSSDDLLQREELKTVFGGYDGFYCAGVYNYCDSNYPGPGAGAYQGFDHCMRQHGC